MQQQTTDRRAPRPTTAADLWRLAERGRGNGVIILTECISGARYATSSTQPGVIYYLTAYSCTCPGFAHHQRCQHHSLLLAELGWLPDVADDEADPAPLATPAPVAVVDLTDERRDDLAERRHRAEQARQRLAARALDPGADDRGLAATNVSRAARMAAGISLVAHA